MNRLSVFHEHIFEAAQQTALSVEECLRFAKSCGIDFLECDHWRLEQREEVKALFDRCGMGVSCIYAHFDLLNDSAEVSAQKYTALFDTARYFGAEKVLCIPGFFGEGDRAAQLARFAQGLCSMCEAAREFGITVTVEDFDDENSPCCRTADLLYLLQNVSGLRYTFDTGNFRYCLEDAAHSYAQLKQYVAHVHCKDRSYDTANASADRSNGKPDLSGAVMFPAAVCDGVIGIPQLLRQLQADGYRGVLAIEHFGALDQRQYMARSADNIRAALGAE